MIICSGYLARVEGGGSGKEVRREAGKRYYREKGVAITFACFMKLESK